MRPAVVDFIACPPNTRAIHLQTHEDLLLAVNGPSVWTMQVSADNYYAGRGADALGQQGAQYTSGMRVYDIDDPFRPREIGFYVPEDPEKMVDPRPGRPQVVQSADCFVDANGVIFVTDPNAGLNILQFEG